MLAAVGYGVYPDYKTAGENMIKYSETIKPDKTVEKFYNEKYAKYKRGFSLLKEFFCN